MHNLNVDPTLSNGLHRTLNAGGILNDSFTNGDEPVLHPTTQFLGFHIRANHHLIKPLDDITLPSKESQVDVSSRDAQSDLKPVKLRAIQHRHETAPGYAPYRHTRIDNNPLCE